ncbi:MAG: pentapeptide repeat-containing protein [Bacteroidia bacterium]|nr:pentapeptide repeat-containing protein [Bacteroidia bacterium]MCF8428062.1 pentapeptide repeat-containing protein [Bacteroidia bacterium]MCF8446679.1 pentapeptide repeat-containing protein [Bacteroidia bacterium]
MVFEDEEFNNKNYTVDFLPANEFDNCTFTQCDFSNVDLSKIVFSECMFQDCNFSNVKTNHTAFKDVRFTSCKMLGVHFDNCHEFLLELNFENCQLDHSTFYKLKLKKIIFDTCSLQDVDFSEADLSQACFLECNLSGAIFDRTILEKADFRTATNYSLDPETNRIKKAKFSSTGLAGLLQKYEIEID